MVQKHQLIQNAAARQLLRVGYLDCTDFSSGPKDRTVFTSGIIVLFSTGRVASLCNPRRQGLVPEISSSLALSLQQDISVSTPESTGVLNPTTQQTQRQPLQKILKRFAKSG